MTLTALRIANFKAFATTQRVPLRPITLVYGANSAEKSSILYREHLAPVLRCANSFMFMFMFIFIDPHLDPARHQYR